jgi:hypothetical protein
LLFELIVINCEPSTGGTPTGDGRESWAGRLPSKHEYAIVT